MISRLPRFGISMRCPSIPDWLFVWIQSNRVDPVQGQIRNTFPDSGDWKRELEIMLN